MIRTKFSKEKMTAASNKNHQLFSEKQVKFLAKEALRHSGGFLMLNWNLIEKFGLVTASILANYIDKQNYFEINKPENNGWFYLTYESISIKLGIGEHTIVKSKQKLMELGVLKTKKIGGIPNYEWITIDFYELINMLNPTENEDMKEDEGFKAISTGNQGDIPPEIKAISTGNQGTYIKTKSIKTKTNKTISNTSSSGDDENSDSDSNKSIELFPTINESMFSQFWKLYPKKVEKGKSIKAWEKTCRLPKKKRPTWEEIGRAIHDQKNSERWKNPQFIPMPSTWLNEYRWLDDPKEMKGSFNIFKQINVTGSVQTNMIHKLSDRKV